MINERAVNFSYKSPSIPETIVTMPSTNTVNAELATIAISSANIDGTGFMLSEMAKYTANTGMTAIATANTNLDGTGTLGTVLTAASNGTFIKTVTIKPSASVTKPGVVRLFVYDGTNTRLISEIEIIPVPSSGKIPVLPKTFYVGYNLKAGYILKASTDQPSNFNVIAEGLDWVYP